MKKNLSCIVLVGMLVFLTGCASGTKTHTKSLSQDSLGKGTTRTSLVQETDMSQMSNQEIQIALKNAGYYVGSIDGILGSRSRDAIRRFQQDNGLKDDSIAGPRTQEKLTKYIDTKFKP